MTSEMPIEVRHERGAMAVTARLPGVLAQHLRVDVTRDQLRIRAESVEGPVDYALPLAIPVDEGRAVIHFARGILSVFLPPRPGR
jgi:HSP20 family molecular chaperone IbpA